MKHLANFRVPWSLLKVSLYHEQIIYASVRSFMPGKDPPGTLSFNSSSVLNLQKNSHRAVVLSSDGVIMRHGLPYSAESISLNVAEKMLCSRHERLTLLGAFLILFCI